MGNLKQPNSEKQSRAVLAKGQKEGEIQRNYYSMGTTFQLQQMSKLWRSALDHCAYS